MLEVVDGKVPVRSPTGKTIAEAGVALRCGQLVAVPTETVYGLMGDATNEAAVAAIFLTKTRPFFNPLIIHIASTTEARELAHFDANAEKLAAAFWPGPLTLVLPRREQSDIALLASAGLDTLALRLPEHPVARAVITAAGRPLAGPSANPSGRISPTSAEDVADTLAGDVIAMVIDGGRAQVGVESTILALIGGPPSLLRPGGIAREDLAAVLGTPVRDPDFDDGSAPHSPGRLLSHYAPDLKVRLDATSVAADEALLAFGAHIPAGARTTLNLSPVSDLGEAAANLFSMLRALDRSGARCIAVMPIPAHGLGEAICDRLARAAAPRPSPKTS